MELLHNGRGEYPREKIFKNFFPEMIPLGVKTCEESEFDIFEAKKRFPDSEKACVLKRKVAKIALSTFRFNTH